MKKILAAVSGGVDSAAAAAMLQRAGYETACATMLLCSGAEREAESARRTAEQLGLPFYLFDWREEFSRLVQRPFLESYRAGLTPNPCIVCNKTVKFGLFLEKALSLGFDAVATGHYARVEQDAQTGRWTVRTGADRQKDQSYMFWTLSQSQLSHILTPLGGMNKEQTRALAAELGLFAADRHDSQDICFVPDGDYMAFLTAHGLIPTAGRFRGENGEDYGAHRGMEAYTLGQRRGLSVAAGKRIYVTGKRGADVFLGPEQALMRRRVALREVNWQAVEKPDGPLRAQARLRYTPQTAACTVCPLPDGAELVFDEPQRAPTPGQSAVFYEDGRILGGGIIAEAFAE